MMVTPKSVTWPCDPHTKAKHELLGYYLDAWFPIVMSRFPRVTYAEGFAGPGIYSTGEPGSPVIALRKAAGAVQKHPGRTAQFVLVEDDPRRLDELKKRVADEASPPGIRTTFHRGECADVLLPALQAARAHEGGLFAFLDSYGGPDIPFGMLRALAQARSAEVLLTFAPNFLTRFGSRDVHRAAGDRTFGGPHWQGVLNLASDAKHGKAAFLVEQYRTTFRRAGFRYQLSFEMLDEGGHPLHLIFGTNSIKGLEKMKDAMWRVDPVLGMRYRDQRDPDQLTLGLDLEPDTTGLRQALLRYLDEHLDAGATGEELRQYALLETIYRPGQVLKAAEQLVEAGSARRTPGRATRATRYWSNGRQTLV